MNQFFNKKLKPVASKYPLFFNATLNFYVGYVGPRFISVYKALNGYKMI